MHNLKKKNNTLIDRDNNSRFLNPSFSSTLLDQIYRSIDQGDNTKSPEMKFYRQRTTTEKKQNHKWTETTIMDNNKRRDNNKVSENVVVGVVGTEKMDRRRRRSRDYDQDVMFFSSASFSSDSSSSFSGGLSSSDTESLYGTRSRASSSCLPPLRPKPVRTSMSCRYEEQGGDRRFHSFRHVSNAELSVSIGDADEALVIKSKSRALKIYNNLKKVKQPISPGGKITSFLNSIFASSKKTRSAIENANNTISTTTKSCSIIGGRLHRSDDAALVSCKDAKNGERKAKSIQVSTCSSASSFSRSCLSKTNSCDRDKLCNGVKRTVRFYPLSVVVGEDCRPCGHKRVCEEEGKVAKASKSPTKNNAVEKSRVVEEAAREFLEKYHRNKKKNDLVLKDLNLPISTKINANEDDVDNDDDDDGASCASSDLFELDHLAVFGNGRYCEELPVYETTHVSTNRAIANGLIM